LQTECVFGVYPTRMGHHQNKIIINKSSCCEV